MAAHAGAHAGAHDAAQVAAALVATPGSAHLWRVRHATYVFGLVIFFCMPCTQTGRHQPLRFRISYIRNELRDFAVRRIIPQFQVARIPSCHGVR
eukprot:1249020-Prymnesium_polylepis.1